VTNNIITSLNRDLGDLLQKSVQDQLGRNSSLVGSGVLSRANPNEPKINIHTLLNNLDVSSEYILKLKKEMESEAQRLFNAIEPKLRSGLDELSEVSNNYRKVLLNYLDQYSLAITNRLKPQLDIFTSLNYELSEMEFAEREINDPFVQHFIAAVDVLVQPYKSVLTSVNYDNMVHILIKFISQRLEHDILKKKFNQLGGLQLDKELRVLQNYFASITQKTVRDKFARVTQMAALLYLEKVAEVLDFWGQNSGHMTWRLTPGEVRRVLSLRVDFSKDAIAKLKL